MENNYCSAVELPYKGNRFSMIVVLPCDSSDVTQFEQELSAETLGTITQQLDTADVKLVLPRFSIATESISLKPYFQNLGMVEPFKDNGHFKKICENP